MVLLKNITSLSDLEISQVNLNCCALNTGIVLCLKIKVLHVIMLVTEGYSLRVA